MSIVSASAPGKLMLLGEHAVVYGHPCIVTAVDLRIRAKVNVSKTGHVSINSMNLHRPYIVSISELRNASVVPKEVRFVAIAIKRFWEYVGEYFGVEVTTQSEFTESFGLGSSSAVTVATIKALSKATGYDMDESRIFSLGYETVLEAQEGVGSGFDIAAASFGGTLYYVTGGKVITPMTVDNLPLVVGYSGNKADTTNYVKIVASRRQQFPTLVDTVMESIGTIVKRAKLVLKRGDYSKLGQLMNLNQGWLQALGVSTNELDYLINISRLSGAYGSKLSGAGGGDCMVALINEENRVAVEGGINYSNIPGAKVIRLRTNAEGVRIETNR